MLFPICGKIVLKWTWTLSSYDTNSKNILLKVPLLWFNNDCKNKKIKSTGINTEAEKAAAFLAFLDYSHMIYMLSFSSAVKSLVAVYHSVLGVITEDPLRIHYCILWDQMGLQSLSVSGELPWIYWFITLLLVNDAVFSHLWLGINLLRTVRSEPC